MKKKSVAIYAFAVVAAISALALTFVLSAYTSEPGACLVTGVDKQRSVGYKDISPEEAKKIMDSGEDSVILDVRTKAEYDEGHIPGALLLEVDDVAQKASEVLPDKSKTVLVYCRSGRRSKIAADELVSLGYTDVREFGGINDWPYEVEK